MIHLFIHRNYFFSYLINNNKTNPILLLYEFMMCIMYWGAYYIIFKVNLPAIIQRFVICSNRLQGVMHQLQLMHHNLKELCLHNLTIKSI